MLAGHWEFSQELFIRLSLALAAGLVLGLNRWLHHKSAGVRTHSLVSVGAALAMLAIVGQNDGDAQAGSRVMQGLLTGMGFLGAGVIIQIGNSQDVRGLTTAASLWACALLGATFGAGQHALGIIAIAAIMLVLVLGGRLERLCGHIFGVRGAKDKNGNDDDEDDGDDSVGGRPRTGR